MLLFGIQIPIDEVDRAFVNIDPTFQVLFSSLFILFPRISEAHILCTQNKIQKTREKPKQVLLRFRFFTGTGMEAPYTISFLYKKEYMYMLQGPRLKNKGQK